jgi:CRP/FNR family transcriptional regulator
MADILLNFSNHIFQSKIFDLPLSRDEMADYIGVSKKSFIRTLSEFRHDKLIKVEGKKVEIVREDLLQMLSRIG